LFCLKPKCVLRVVDMLLQLQWRSRPCHIESCSIIPFFRPTLASRRTEMRASGASLESKLMPPTRLLSSTRYSTSSIHQGATLITALSTLAWYGLHCTRRRRGIRCGAASVARAAGASAVGLVESVAEEISVSRLSELDCPPVGNYEVICSDQAPVHVFEAISTLGTEEGAKPGTTIWIRARVAAVRVKGKTTFVVLRQHSLHTVQAVKFKSKEDGGESAKQFAQFFKALPLESVVDINGTVVEANVSGCTQSKVELQMNRAYCVSQASSTLPFLLADAQRSDAQIEASLTTDRPYVRVLPDLRLDFRWLDLRIPAHNAIMRVQGGVCHLFRNALMEQGFIEIHSPKLIAGESEGGAEVFRTDYFGKQASLAQSPQIYKQMAISADLPGVFEVGPVFRAENSNTSRHLCEFTGLDLEMPIRWHYSEVIDMVHMTLFKICKGIEAEYQDVLDVVRSMYPSEAPLVSKEPCVVHWEDMNEMLKGAGIERDPLVDLSTEEERILGKLVREKYETDIFFLDRYPSAVRPFYTMPCKDDPSLSNSFDVIFRGQEIGSGAQRCHDPKVLQDRCDALGVPMGPLQAYIDSFRHGVSPHGGVGLGLERIVQMYLDLDNIRKAVFFARDPARLSP